jgi:hypothetical protein
LLGLARTVKYEDMHALTREEIASFGIDRRALAETLWTFENTDRSMVRKAVARRDDGEEAYRMSQWRLSCFNAEQFELDLQRPAVTPSIFPTVQISSRNSTALYFRSSAVKAKGFEFWAMRINKASLQALAGEPQFDFIETSQTPDGRRRAHTVKLSSEGLAGALDRLVAACPPAKPMAPMRTVGSRDNAGKK